MSERTTIPKAGGCVFCGEDVSEAEEETCPLCFSVPDERDRFKLTDEDLRLPFLRLTAQEWRELAACLCVPPDSGPDVVQAKMFASMSRRVGRAKRYADGLRTVAKALGLLGRKAPARSVPELEGAVTEKLQSLGEKDFLFLERGPLAALLLGPLGLAARLAGATGLLALGAGGVVAAGAIIWALVMSGVNWRQTATWMPIIHKARERRSAMPPRWEAI